LTFLIKREPTRINPSYQYLVEFKSDISLQSLFWFMLRWFHQRQTSQKGTNPELTTNAAIFLKILCSRLMIARFTWKWKRDVC